MPYNNLLVPSIGEELSRVKAMLANTLDSFRSGDITTREDLLVSYADSVNRLQKTLDTFITDYELVSADTEPSIQYHNGLVNDVATDIQLLFIQMNLLAELMIAVFNQIVSESEDLTGHIRRVSSKLADYELISGEGGISIGESFSDTNSLSLGSSLITTDECEVDTIEGVTTLNQNVSTIVEVISVSVDETLFNGVLGNNEDIDVASGHGALSDVIDGNPDTWTEFEKTYFDDEDQEPLQLRLILKLKELSVVNAIVIDPINFGLLDSVSVEDIRVSATGSSWISISGDIPLAAYLNETDKDVYKLGTGSKFSGKFSYTFLPRRIQYLAVDLKQNSGYRITTSLGDKIRYAIGLKSIDLFSIEFSSTSELVSVPLKVEGGIAKVGLLGAYRPIESTLGKIDFSVSFDGGTSWNPVQPLTEDDLSAPEILTVESDVDEFVYKISMTRDDSAFEKLDSIEDEDKFSTTFESANVSIRTSPISLFPSKQLASSDVVIMNSPIGSRGDQEAGRLRFEIGTGTGGPVSVQLPFSIYPDSDIKTEHIRVYVSGVEWTQLDDQKDLDAADPEDNVYYITSDGFVVFGSGNQSTNTGNGKSPESGARIQLSLIAEELFFEPTEGGWLAKFDLTASGNKNSTKLERVNPISAFVTEVLPRGETVLKLKFQNVDSNSFSVTERNSSGNISTDVFTTEVDDKSDAIGVAGKYYVDYKKGVIFTGEETASDKTSTVVYKYYRIDGVSDYKYVKDSSGAYGGIFIAEEDLVSDTWTDVTSSSTSSRDPYGFDGTETQSLLESILVWGNVIRLSQKNVLKGSLVLEDGIFGSDITAKEVDFINGHIELSKLLSYTQEIDETSATGLYTFGLLGASNINKETGVSFSDTTAFATEVTDTPNANGEYKVNYSTGDIQVYLAAGISAGTTATYYVSSPQINTDGLYSVDYKNGIIYCSTTPLESGDKGGSGFDIVYDYTKYRIHYVVARALGSDEFTVNVSSNKISVVTDKLLNGNLIFSYEYIPDIEASIKELAPFYSPLLRDLRFRVITADMLVS